MARQHFPSANVSYNVVAAFVEATLKRTRLAKCCSVAFDEATLHSNIQDEIVEKCHYYRAYRKQYNL